MPWTVNAYNLTFACLLLTGAALGDRFGRRRMLCVGLSIFVGASLLAGLAPTIGVLVAARAMQGIGAATMVPLTLTLVTDAYPPERRGWAIGIWTGIGALSGAIGPFVGGALVQGIGWHWIFWINVPIGLALIPIVLLRARESHGGHPRLDLPGVVLATAGLFGITGGIVRTSTLGWGSDEVIVPLIAGLATVGLFVLWERRTPHPMLPLSMFRRASFSRANGISFCLFAGLFGALFLMSQFFQTGQGRTPLQAGAAARLRCGHRAGVPNRGERGDVIGRPRPDGHRLRSQQRAARARRGVRRPVLASVFNRPGVYSSPDVFVAGFRSALWVAVAFSAIGIPLALSLKRSLRAAPAVLRPTP